MADVPSRLSVLETEMSALREQYRELKVSLLELQKAHNKHYTEITDIRNTLKVMWRIFSFVATAGPSFGVLVAKWLA